MTLKEELEILRGEPIQVFDGDPMDIPCIETSDSEKLCKNPVVSVRMITYNHEPYIRQAIEGVMMQKTDFEFELIIGEDCSQDKTREICFEYQKKYPDKIRVLWWHENVSKLGGNSRRVRARCRGEFIAFCEGDDWWIDETKLQKQVDAMRKYPEVGLCFTDGYSRSLSGDWEKSWHDYNYATWFEPNIPIPSSTMAREFCLGRPKLGRNNAYPFILTATAMYRRSSYQIASAKYDIFNWRLTLGDLIVWLGLASVSSICYVPVFAVKRNVLPTGAQTVGGARVFRDGFLVRYYFASKNFDLTYQDLPQSLRLNFFSHVLSASRRLSSVQQRKYGRLLLSHLGVKSDSRHPVYLLELLLIRLGLINKFTARVIGKFIYWMS